MSDYGEVVERAHNLAAVSHLIPSGEWTPALVALVAALHDLTAAELEAYEAAGIAVAGRRAGGPPPADLLRESRG